MTLQQRDAANDQSQAEGRACAPASVRGGVVAYLQLDGAMKAAEFYRRAFRAEVAAFHPVDAQGRTPHVHLYVNGSSVMLCDGFSEHGCPAKPAQGFNLMLEVEDIESWWGRALDAGATVALPLSDMFWGARYGQLRDPFGIVWALNQPLR